MFSSCPAWLRGCLAGGRCPNPGNIQGWTEFWTPWSSWRCPCSVQVGGLWWSLPTQTIRWLCDLPKGLTWINRNYFWPFSHEFPLFSNCSFWKHAGLSSAFNRSLINILWFFFHIRILISQAIRFSKMIYTTSYLPLSKSVHKGST